MTKKKKNNSGVKFIVGFIIVLIIFAGFIYIQKKIDDKKINKDSYNGFSFGYDEYNKLWITQINWNNKLYNIPFYYHPTDLEKIVVQNNVENIILRNKPSDIIISVPSDSSSEIALAGIEISKITGTRFDVLNIPTTSALSEKVEGFPFADCRHSSQERVVIIFKKSDKNYISGEENCITLEFKQNQSIQVADSFSYHLLKIM
ncbi:MAG: hypothetical protein ABH828_05045 [archaeon]